jgi:Holliday junction DNA helicase RuvB
MRQEPDLEPTNVEMDEPFENSLRPSKLSDFIGQHAIKESLSIFLKAAIQREEPLDHLLLYGPPGLGKTTLAQIVAYEMASQIHVTSGPAIARPGDLVGILTNLESNAVLFIDEIHRLSRQVEEILYPAMEDRKVDIMIGQGPAARSIRLDVPPITVVGATTRQGLLTGPLRDRFGIVSSFEYYDEEALCQIIQRSSEILGYKIDPGGAEELAKRSRGTPRIANRLLRRVRDYAQVWGEEMITSAAAAKALEALKVDHLGLDRLDRAILDAIITKYRGGPVGLETLAATVGEDAGTIEDVYEPFLIQRGLIARTPRGREAAPLAYEHLGHPQPNR